MLPSVQVLRTATTSRHAARFAAAMPAGARSVCIRHPGSSSTAGSVPVPRRQCARLNAAARPTASTGSTNARRAITWRGAVRFVAFAAHGESSHAAVMKIQILSQRHQRRLHTRLLGRRPRTQTHRTGIGTTSFSPWIARVRALDTIFSGLAAVATASALIVLSAASCTRGSPCTLSCASATLLQRAHG